MRIKEVIEGEQSYFKGDELSYILIGLLSAFESRFQALADSVLNDMSWKQFFVIVCIHLCKEKPTVKEIAHMMGCSHQNVKQLLIKLEKKGFLVMKKDEYDKRKQRIELTQDCILFCKQNDKVMKQVMMEIFDNITEEELKTTIKTIIQMDNHLKRIKEKI